MNPQTESSPKDGRLSFTLIVPLYNEEKIISGLSGRLREAERALAADYSVSILLVDDHSRDETFPLAQRMAESLENARTVRHDVNQGVAGAIATGLREARTEIAASMDADGTYDVTELAAMLPMLGRSVDLVTASPYHPEGGVDGVSPFRLLLSRCASVMYRRIFRQKLHTYTSCFRVYRRSAFKDLKLRFTGFAGIAEMAAWIDQRGGAIVEHPARLGVRRAGRSHLRLVPAIAQHLHLATALWRGAEPAIPNDQDASGRSLGKEELDLLAATIRSGTLTSTKGTFVRRFEGEFATWLGTDRAFACSSGTTAIHAAIAAVDPEPGDEVITSPITDMGALAPILYQGAIPVFADVDPCTGNVTARTIEERLSSRTRAIVVTHLFGNPCEMDAILELANRIAVPVIEDCAQAFGASAAGRRVGTQGAVGCFSLQQGKHITTGEGGILTTNDRALSRRIELFLNKGWGYEDDAPDHEFLALNGRMNELSGAVALAQLPKLEGAIRRRREAAAQLTLRLSDLSGVETPAVRAGDVHSFWKYDLRLDERRIAGGFARLAVEWRAAGIAVTPRYIRKPAFECSIFQKQRTFGRSRYPFTLARPEAVDYSPEKYPGAYDYLNRVVVLGWNENYRAKHIEAIAAAVRASLAG